MAVEDMRNHGVRPLTPSDIEGSRGQDGRGVNLPTSTYENPGPTPNIRGIEPNTNLDAGMSAPEVQTETVEGYTRDAPFNAPSDERGDVEGPGDPGWQNYDSSANSSTPVDPPQVGSFSKFGEKYPGFGDPDHDAG